MSPKTKEKSQKVQSNTSNSDQAMMHRRRQQQAADGAAESAAEPAANAAAAASSADDRAAAEVQSATGLEMIGQEMVLASEALVPVPATTSNTERALRTPVRGSGNRETPNTSTELRQGSIQNVAESPIPNGSDGQRDGKMSQVKDEGSQLALTAPDGPPISYGPGGESAARSLLPLFTPEQVQHMEAVQRAAPILSSPGVQQGAPGQGLGRHERGVAPGQGLGLLERATTPEQGLGLLDHLDRGIGAVSQSGLVRQALMASMQAPLAWMGGGLQQVLAPYALQHPGNDPGHRDGQDLRSTELSWRIQMERQMELLGLELWASHSENQRLRGEIRDLIQRKESSTYGTPDGVSGAQREVAAEEDGPAGQQEFEEDGPAGQQEFEEDGPAGQQESQEDGLVSQQEVKEDGPESRQGASRIPEEGLGRSTEGRKKNDAPRAKATSSPSTTEWMIGVVLKLMEGMQDIQRQMVSTKGVGKEDEVEWVRFASELPKLPEWSPETSPIDYGDWIVCLHSHMADLTPTSEEWWETTLETAKGWYQRHMQMTPIQRLTHAPEKNDKLDNKKWGRLERRAASMLMAALPEQLREEIVASKSVTTMGILTKAMIQYQPGGLTERSAILNALEAPTEASSIANATTLLRRWIRWRRRAVEVGVSLPDATILMRGIAKLTKKVLFLYPDLSFRLSLARNTLLVDTVPTQETVAQYSEHVLAELEQMGHHAKRREAQTEPNPKIKKFEEMNQGEEKGRPKGKPREEVEGKKSPCKFFLQEGGCRRGRQCPYGHVMDDQKRCWTCGSKEHFASTCPRSEDKPAKAAKMGARSNDKEAKNSSSSAVNPPAEEPKVEDVKEESQGEDTMKVLLEEANRMLKSMGQGEATERSVNLGRMDQLVGLQKQLDEIKKASLRTFRISKLTQSQTKGLLDSGATHPLRPRRKGERTSHFSKVTVNLAGDRQVVMHLAPSGVIIGAEGTEPIIPMGDEAGLQVWHPKRGRLPIQVEDGCPMVSQEIALSLIEELEEKAGGVIRALKMTVDQETAWLAKLVREHPAFASLPEKVKAALIEPPADHVRDLGNRRMRKLWRKKGMVIHAFSGEDSGYHLKRAFHEVGGDKRLIYEFDKLHGKKEKDFSPQGSAYPTLLRAALDGMVQAWIGGPPCRTRSMLRHLPVNGGTGPRPLRAWDGEEFGKRDLNMNEKEQVEGDDILMWRFLLLYVVSDTVRKVKEEKPTKLLMEQPADLPTWPEVVTIWRTKEWRMLEKIHGLDLQTFNQSEFGALATKPTSTGGNLPLQVPLPGRKGTPRRVEGKSNQEIFEDSRNLARWPPAMMRGIAEAIQVTDFHQPVKIRQLSWSEHVAAGHTPFRRDCRVCQEAAARDCVHRRSKPPAKVGVLSLDTAGPFRRAPDLHKRTARYLLVGAFTWFKTKNDEEKPEERA